MGNETVLESEIVVGEVLRAEEFEECRKEKMVKLVIDLGDEEVQSAAQLLFHHEVEELEGRQVLCAKGLGEVNIAGFVSEVLTLGVPGDDGNPVLVTPDEEVPLGGRLY
ncbi:MAG: tRNA-binding protein [Candidatus Nanohaloarchaea archaeon]